MLKHLSLMGVLLCGAMLLFVACAKSDDAETASNKGDAKFVFKVGFDASFPPYGYKDNNGNLVGFDLDLAREVAKRRGWKIELKPIDWDSKDAELTSGTINCIWNGFTINGRETQYEWTEPYVDNTQVVIVRTDSGMNTLADLAGKTVAAQVDSSGLAAIKSDEHKALLASIKKLVEVPDFLRAFMELESGAADAVVVDHGVAMTQINGKAKFRLLSESLKAEQYGVGFKLGNKTLRDQVQETFKEMVKDGAAREISRKWFNGENVIVLKP